MAPAGSLMPEVLRMAHPTPKRQRPEEIGHGPVVAGVEVGLLILCTAAVGLRVWARGWVFRHAKVWGWDDTLAVLGFVRSLPYPVYMPA